MNGSALSSGKTRIVVDTVTVVVINDLLVIASVVIVVFVVPVTCIGKPYTYMYVCVFVFYPTILCNSHHVLCHNTAVCLPAY